MLIAQRYFSVALLLTSPLAYSASFDCDKASTLVEQSICSNNQLSTLDDTLSATYIKALKASSNPSSIRERQRNWIQSERNTCKNITCLTAAYTSRLGEFRKSTSSRYSLSANQGQVTVPENQQWIIEGFKPWHDANSPDRDIGTADLYFDGSVLVENKYNLYGKFELSVSGTSAPIIVYAGTKLSVGDSRGDVTIKTKLAQ
jgi:uncharacterized protein